MRMILLANSTPMVCEERERHSFLMKRWRRHDLRGGLAIWLRDKGGERGRGVNALPTAAGAEENDLREVIVHASQLLRGLLVGSRGEGGRGRTWSLAVWPESSLAAEERRWRTIAERIVSCAALGGWRTDVKSLRCALW